MGLASTNVPTIEHLDELLTKSMTAMETLEQDAFYFSDLFRDKATSIRDAAEDKRKIDLAVSELEVQVSLEAEKIAAIEEALQEKESEADKNFREVQELRDIVMRKKLEVDEYDELLAKSKQRVEELHNQQAFL